MDPHTEKVPGLALPKPASEQGVYNAMPTQHMPETSLSPVQAPPLPVGATNPAQSALQSVRPNSVTPAVAPLAPAQVADDNSDAIDEEWINKAKAIVDQTKHDPHLESQELSRVKADYLRIRYNKHIKVVEDQSK